MDFTLYKHYLITRFNLRNEDWKTSKSGSLVLTEEWLKNRFLLFESICIPSVQNQTNQQFTWLVFFDENTPQKYKQKITGYSRIFSNFIPVFINGMPEFLPSIQTEIKKSNSEYIITSRIDNDDCISKDYIDEIQKNFERQKFLALDFPDGYTLQIKPRVKIGYRLQVYNPFVTLIEKNDNPQSVWSKETHGSWKKEKNVKRIKNKRVWMSIIHLENKKNQFVGFGKVDLKILFNDFPISPDIQSALVQQKPKSLINLQSLRNRVTSNWRVFYKDVKKSAGLYK